MMYLSGDEEAVAKRPTPIVGDAGALLRRGIEALERERPNEAVALLRMAAQLAPESAETFLALGVAAMRALLVPEAIRSLERAIELAPQNFFPHFRMAELYLRIGVPTRAREEIQHALDLSENAEQRRMARELSMIDAKRAAKRVWRPDFSRSGRKRGNDQ